MNTWVFRASPKEATVEELLAGHFEQNRPLSWPIRQHRDYVQEGDHAYFWYDDPAGDAALVAKGTIVSPLRVTTPPLTESSMFLDILPGPRVDVRIDELRLTPGGGRIPKTLLLSHPRLRLLPFLHWDQWFDWPLDDAEVKYLEILWSAAVSAKY